MVDCIAAAYLAAMLASSVYIPGILACAGFTPAEEVEEVDTSQEQPQGLAAFVSKLQGFSQHDPFFAILSYKDFKPDGQQKA